ncbi:hypothetical protein GII36_03720 [Candidatus Mycosynbacter amalyticus]|uniref:Uncharacterized protein n=1 Tax=Candidatus Mycosynbacter amalyticus TaxID=2665156 RepID=A0A857MU65_9BACT|nr:hypothetical protein [Candidatus Mycosynbacter amalyticus]QHN42947.1 hypothetical protein GII36_03720 [Candidatus Mycosynbacter amalyticus]
MKSDDNLLEDIQNSRADLQKQFDTAKLTVATAGLLVALGLNDTWSESSPVLWGYSSYKVTVILVLISMLLIILGYLVSELTMKWFEKFMAKGDLNWWQRIIRDHSSDRGRRVAIAVHGFCRVKLPNISISFLNHCATLSLVLAIISFVYMVSGS